MKKLSVFVVMIGICVFTLTGCFGQPREEGNGEGEKHGGGKTDAGIPKTDAGTSDNECVVTLTPPPTVTVSAAFAEGIAGTDMTSDGKIIGPYSVLGDCQAKGSVKCKLDALEENARVMDVNLQVIANGQVFYACYSDGTTFQDFGTFELKCGETKYKAVKVANGANGCNYRVYFYGKPVEADGGTVVTDAGTTDAGTTDVGGTADAGIDAGATDAGYIDPGTQYQGNFTLNCVPPSGYSTCTMYVGYGIVQNGAQTDKLDMTAPSGKLIAAQELCHSWWSPNAAEMALKAVTADGTSTWIRSPDGNIILLDPRGTRVPLIQLAKPENVGTGSAAGIRYCANPAY